MAYEFLDKDTDEQEIKRAGRRSIAFGIIIGLGLLLAIGFFFWGNLINRGTLAITGEAPFSVEIFGGEQYSCETSPCEHKMKSGIKDLLIRKEGHQTLFEEAKIKIWRMTELNVEFQIAPQITKTIIIPEIKKEPEYRLFFDKETQMQKLIRADDDRKEAIVYFAKALSDAKIFGSKNYVLVVADDVYKIDIRKKTREKIEGIDGVKDGKWADSGEYFVFSKEGDPYLWLLNGKKVQQLEINSEISQVEWLYNDQLIFVSKQAYNISTKIGKYGDKYIELLGYDAESGATFGIFHPDENSYTRIENFSEILEVPKELIVTESGDAIYFSSRDENFKIILRKF